MYCAIKKTRKRINFSNPLVSKGIARNYNASVAPALFLLRCLGFANAQHSVQIANQIRIVILVVDRVDRHRCGFRAGGVLNENNIEIH